MSPKDIPVEPHPMDIGGMVSVQLITPRRVWPVRLAYAIGVNIPGAVGHIRADEREPWIPVKCERITRVEGRDGAVYVVRSLRAP